MPFLYSTFVKKCDHEVLMTKGMSLEKQSLLCAAQPTHAHKTQETLIRNPNHFLDPKLGKILTTALEFWVKPKINRCADLITLLLKTHLSPQAQDHECQYIT